MFLPGLQVVTTCTPESGAPTCMREQSRAWTPRQSTELSLLPDVMVLGFGAEKSGIRIASVVAPPNQALQLAPGRTDGAFISSGAAPRR